jgi:2-C-methyl-D-erythritol 4-phosphate cytidylyltransferase
MEIDVIIPAAGIGSRFSDKVKKQFFLINEKPVFYHTLKKLYNSYIFNKFLIGASKEDFNFIQGILTELNISNYELVIGGKERQDTVYNCLKKSNSDFVLIHDAVRPFVKKDVIVNTIEKAFECGAAICGLFVKDTVKYVHNNEILKTLDRNFIFLAHTPQVFKLEILKEAASLVKRKKLFITDESQAVEILGYKVEIVSSNQENIKITTKSDLTIKF